MAGDSGKCGCADREGEDQRYRAIGADPAVLHDEEALLAALAAANAIGRIGQAVLVQRPGDDDLDGKRDQGRHQRIGAQPEKQEEGECGRRKPMTKPAKGKARTSRPSLPS